MSEKPIIMGTNGRNKDGTVKKGYVLNPNGRPPRRKIEDYITENDVVKIVEKAREEALNGKPDLLKELLGYMFGKPKQQIELSGGEEPITFEIKDKANKSIKEYLNDNTTDTTGDGSEANKISIPIQSEEH